MSHSVSCCNQKQSIEEGQKCVQTNYNMKPVVGWQYLKGGVIRQWQVALKHIPSVLSIRPSSTGREAFTESSGIQFHSLVSSLFAYLCSYSAKSVLFSKAALDRNLYLFHSPHTILKWDVWFPMDKTVPQKTWLLIKFKLPTVVFYFQKGTRSTELFASVLNIFDPGISKMSFLFPVPSPFPRKNGLCSLDQSQCDFSALSMCVSTHLAVPDHSLISCDSDILASVFLTRRAVRREAGLCAQHSVISFPICLKHCRNKVMMLRASICVCYCTAMCLCVFWFILPHHWSIDLGRTVEASWCRPPLSCLHMKGL